MATYWENSCSFGLRYVSWYKYLIVSLVFSHLGFWSGNLFLIAPFPDLCLLVPFNPASYTTAISEAAIAGRENNLSLLLNCVLQKYYHFLGAYCTVFFFFFYNVAKYFQKLIEEWSNHDMYL